MCREVYCPHPVILCDVVDLSGNVSLPWQWQLSVLTRVLSCSLGTLAMTETIKYTLAMAGNYCSPLLPQCTPSLSQGEVSLPVPSTTLSPANGSTEAGAETDRTDALGSCQKIRRSEIATHSEH